MVKIPTSRELIERATVKAARVFAKFGAIAVPIWTFYLPNGREVVLPSPVPDKDVTAALMRELFEDNHVVAYLFVAEAWVMEHAKLADVPRIVREGVNRQPERVEAICYQAEDADGTCSAQQIIERKEGEPAILLPLQWINSVEMRGRFVGMLPRNGKTQH